MTRLVLHVGLSKTGTTAFQEFASANAPRMAALGLRYADMVRGPNHSQLAVAFSRQSNRISESLGVHDDQDRARLRRRLAKRMARAAGQSPAWLISSEQLTTMVRRPRRIAELADFLHSIFDDVTVLAVVRRGDYWLPSSYVEAVASGETRPMNAQFVTSREFLLRHRRLLRDWGRAFGGAGKVRAVPFLESDKSSPSILPARLLAAAGLPHQQVVGWPTPAGIRNPSLSATAVELLRTLNPQLEVSALRPVSSRRQIVELVRDRFPGPPPLLTTEAAEALHERRLVWTGLPRTAMAAGRGWRAWAHQPDAPCGPPAQLTPDLVERMRAELVVEQSADAILPAAAASPLRRLAIRVTRR